MTTTQVMADIDIAQKLATLPVKERTLFVQLYRSAMRAMRGLAFEAPMAHGVLYVLLERMNQRNALVASQATLAKLTGKSPKTIQRALAELSKRNFIEIVRAGNLSVIVVNKRVAWTTDTALRERLAVFDAQVIVSASEQDDPESLDNETPLVQLPPMLVPPEIGSLLDDEDPTIAGQQDLPLV
jgi:DNA-binding transcriptional regulator YhcF (GntR family)